MSMTCSLLRWFALSAMLLAGLATTATLHAQSSPSDYTSAARYDALGREVGTIAPDPDGGGALKYAATRTTYDNRALPIKVESGELSSWQSEAVLPENWGTAFTILSTVEASYDVNRRKIKTVTKGSDNVITGVTHYSYDNRGRLLCTAVRMNPAQWNTQTDACTLQAEGGDGPDRITKNIYDDASQVLKVQSALGVKNIPGEDDLEQDTVTYTYTDNGQKESVTDANGNRAAYEYDDYDRLIKWSFPSKTDVGQTSATDFEEYEYDANGNRTKLTKRDGAELTYTYDNLNRMTVKSVPARTGVDAIHTRDVHYDYDLRGLQTAARFDSLSGVGVDNVYDGFGRMTSSINRMAGTSAGVALTLTYEYDDNGNRTKVTHPDGAYFTYIYDGLNRNKYIKENGSTLLKNAFYNNRGLMKQNTRASGVASQTGFDAIGRVSSMTTILPGTAQDNIFGFTYNPASQIKSRTTSNDLYANTAHYDVDRSYSVNGLNQYTTAGAIPFAYDDNGNLTTDGDPNVDGVAFLYDNENRLVGASGARTAELIYDPLGRLWEINQGPSHKRRFLYDGDAMVEERNELGTILGRYVHGGGVDNPLAWYQGDSVGSANRRHLFSNWQGSITAITDDAGTAIAVNAYDAYGIPNDTNITEMRFSYTGQIWLNELGLYHYKARAYSPTLGRFLQTDPIGYEDQYNLYAYVGNDPVNMLDPTGKDSVWVYPNGTIIVVVPVVNQSHLPDSDVLKGFEISGTTSDGRKVRVGAILSKQIDSVSVTTDPSLTRSHADMIGGRQIRLRSSATKDTVRHEAGHSLGAGDQYKGGVDADGKVLQKSVPGSSNTLMGGDTTQRRKPNTQTIDEIADQAVSSPRNTVRYCKAGQHPRDCS